MVRYDKERTSVRERDGTSCARAQCWNKCRPGLGGCRRADRLSRFHGRSFALLTAGRERQTLNATSAIPGKEERRETGRTSRREAGARRTERNDARRGKKTPVTRARTRVNACLRPSILGNVERHPHYVVPERFFRSRYFRSATRRLVDPGDVIERLNDSRGILLVHASTLSRLKSVSTDSTREKREATGEVGEDYRSRS